MTRLFRYLLFTTLSLCGANLAMADVNKIGEILDKEDIRCAQGRCDYAASEAILDNALKNAKTLTDRTHALYYLAEVRRRKGQFKQAVETGMSLLKLDPKHMRIHATLGESYAKLGQLPQAAAHFAQAAVAPEVEHARFNACRLAQTELTMGRVDAAGKSLPAAHPGSPRQAACLQNLAVDADKKQHHKLAAQAYHLAAQSRPDDVDSWIRAMYLYASVLDQPNAGKVIVEFSKTKAAVPQQYHTMYLYAVTQVAGPADAARIARAWQKQEPGSQWLKERLAMALAAAGEAREAETWFRALLKEGGERRPAYAEQLIDVLAGQRKFSESVAVCEAEQRIVAQSTRLKVKCGDAFQIGGQCTRALPLLIEAFGAKDLDGLLATAAHAAGRCHETAGDWNAALATYHRAPQDARIIPRIKIVRARLGQK